MTGAICYNPAIEAVLLCGGYGVGKSTVCVEIADILDELDTPFAAIDLDWLSWGRYGDAGRVDEVAMLAANRRAVVANYRNAGTPFFVLAWSARDGDEVDAVRAAIACRFASSSSPRRYAFSLNTTTQAGAARPDPGSLHPNYRLQAAR